MRTEIRGLVLIGLLTLGAYFLFDDGPSIYSLFDCVFEFRDFDSAPCGFVRPRLVFAAGSLTAAIFWLLMWFRPEKR